MTDLERLLRETLERDSADYVVSPAALPALHRRLRLGGAADHRPRHRRRVLAAVSLGVAAAVVALAVAPISRRHDSQTPATLGVSSSAEQIPQPSSTPRPPIPPSVGAVKTVPLGFTATRLVLAGSNVWAFGPDSRGNTRVAHLVNLRVVKSAPLPSPVCSASVRDASTGLAVVLSTDPTCATRTTLRLMDPQLLTLGAATAPAVGGDALTRPEGIYAASGGVLALLNPVTLLPTGPTLRLGGPASLVNLANDPQQTRLFATVLDPARHTTRLVTLDRTTLHSERSSSLSAVAGALPYATDAGAVWVSLVGESASQAELRGAAGNRQSGAFVGFPLMTSYAESGARLWSLTPDNQLRCASLTSGQTLGQSTVPAAGHLAADKEHVYAVDGGDGLDIFTPAAGCAAN